MVWGGHGYPNHMQIAVAWPGMQRRAISFADDVKTVNHARDAKKIKAIFIV